MKRFLSFALFLPVGCALTAASACAAPPVIQDVQIVRTHMCAAPDWVTYTIEIAVTVSDEDGASDIASVTIRDAAGWEHSISQLSGGQWSQEDDQTICASYRPQVVEQKPAPGSYIVAATDWAENEDSVTTAAASALEALEIVSPTMDSVIEDTTPVFAWQPVLTPSSAALAVKEENTDGNVWWVALGEETSVEYNFDGAAIRTELLPGRTYLWTVSSLSADDDRISDPRVSLWISQTAQGRFTLFEPWPELPALRGKLAYGVCLSGVSEAWGGPEAIMGYNTDPHQRVWLGPMDASYPDWSPDGSSLLYEHGGQMWIDALNGTPPFAIPGITGNDCRWSPDGAQLAFSKYGSYSTDIWVANIDGSDAHIVAGTASYERYPVWSPDGQWIAYRKSDDMEGQGLWLVRPDGTDLHAVMASGVEGYPGYEVIYMGDAGWAPDARRLAVVFAATGPGGAEMNGIGVVPYRGGTLKPVFVSGPEVICCAEPHLPLWSPDGTEIVFTSGHHLPSDELPGWGQFSGGPELWLINADGSGDPVCLTHDRSFDSYISWWAPPLFTDVSPGYWAYCAISACRRANIAAGYPDGTYRPEMTVTRAQAAAYLARAVAGGDDAVPTGPPEPTFRDVPPDHWAYRHIEYCAACGIARGPITWVVTGPGGTEERSLDVFKPKDGLSRAENAVFVARAVAEPMGEEGLDSYVPPTTPSFSDVPTNFHAYKHIEYIHEQGIINGYPDGTYRPKVVCSRGQMAVYLAGAFGLPM